MNRINKWHSIIVEKITYFRQNGAPSGLENRGLDASIYHKTRKPTAGTKVKRKIYVGMDVHKETISIAYLTSNTEVAMIEVLYSMIRTGDLFDSMPEEVLNRKLAQYGLM
nr:hypothetical protein [Leptospira alexanderi]